MSTIPTKIQNEDHIEKENFLNLIKLMEKWYFLTMDEQNHFDFIYFLRKIQEKINNNKEIENFIQEKIEEKLKTLIKIQKLRQSIENQIRKHYKSPVFYIFFTKLSE
ncbi:MAG: hypothetical protein ACK4GJ_05760 [bacterium]